MKNQPRRNVKRTLSTALVALVLMGGGAAAYAAEAPAPEAPSLAADAAGSPRRADQLPTAARKRLARVAKHAVHGDLIINTKAGAETVTFDKGHLVSSGETLVIEREDDVTVELTITEDTKFRGVDSAASLVARAPIFVLSRDGEALVVAQRHGRPARDRSAG